MRYGIGKSLQFLVFRFKLGGPASKLPVETANFILPALALSDIVVRFHDGCRLRLFAAPQRPSAPPQHLGAVSFRSLELAFPTPRTKQLRADVFDWRRKNGAQKFMRPFPNRFFCCEPVQLLGPPVPVRDEVVHVADEDGVMREIEQAGLLGSLLNFQLELVARLKKVSLGAAPDGAEPCN